MKMTPKCCHDCLELTLQDAIKKGLEAVGVCSADLTN